MFDTTQTLRTSLKLQLLHSVLHGLPVSELIDSLAIADVVKSQQYLWDLTIEFGLRARSTRFSRREVTRKMLPTTQYQKKRVCYTPSMINFFALSTVVYLPSQILLVCPS